jgi:hypothetical protein
MKPYVAISHIMFVVSDPVSAWKETVLAYQGICLEGLRKTTKALSQYSLYVCLDSNRTPSEHKRQALTITLCFDHKGSSSCVTIHAHIYQTAALIFTFPYMCLSSAYNSFVSGFVGNTNIHPVTQVKIEFELQFI